MNIVTIRKRERSNAELNKELSANMIENRVMQKGVLHILSPHQEQ